MNTENNNMSNRGIAMFRNGALFMRSTAAVIILAFGGLVTSPAAAAVHSESGQQDAATATGQSHSQRLAAILQAVGKTAGELVNEAHDDRAVASASDSTERSAVRERLKNLRQELAEQDRMVRGDFNAIAKHVRDAALPDEILQRHHDAVGVYKKEMDALLADLAVETVDEQALRERAADIVKRLEKSKLRRSPQPFDPEKLPNRSLEADETREPRVKPEDFVAADAESFDLNRLMAAAGEFDISTLPGADDPAYLGETSEIVLSDAIRAKAAELGNDPVMIRNWVRNNVQWQPAWGAVQNAELTLSARRGNAFDIAGLTIALLRASGIPARYVHGTIEIPEAVFRNWTGGFEHIDAAVEYAASGGIPVATLVSGGRIAAVRMEHVWVEAALDFFPSRGAVNRAADEWVPMDPSFKQYEVLEGLDLLAVSGLDTGALSSEFGDSGTIDETENWVAGLDAEVLANAQDQAQQSLDDYIVANPQDATVGDVLGGREIKDNSRAIFSGALESRIVVAGNRYASLPAGLRQHITFGFGADIFGDPQQSVRFEWARLNNERVTLGFRPATQADEDALQSLLPEDSTDLTQLPSSIPAYLVKVVPELKVGDDVVMTGSAMNLGDELNFMFTPHFASGYRAPNTYSVIAGSYLAVAVVAGNVSPQALSDSRERIEATTALLQTQDPAQLEGLTRDDIYGDMFHSGILGYYSQLNARTHTAGLELGGHHYLAAGLGSYGYEPEVDYLFGFPRAIRPGGAVMNIPIVNAWGFDGDGSDAAEADRLNFILQSGMVSSALEHIIPEQMFNSAQNPTEGISAMKAIQKAVAGGQRIYRIDAANQASALPMLNHGSLVMSEIRQALSAGKVVVTHTDAVGVPGWSGAGYIIYDPVSGDAAYKIAGGQNGGFAALLTGVAQGAAAMAMLLAVFAAFGGGLMAGFAAIILIVFFILPIFLIAIEYANSVFDSDEEQACLGIGRSIGVLLTSLIGGIASKKLRTVLEIIAGAIFIDGMFSGDFEGIGECV